jgi:peroxiredoxin
MRTFALFAMMTYILFASGCVLGDQKIQELAPGTWRATLDLGDDKILPFNFELSGTEGDTAKPVITLRNGEERIVVKDISFRHGKYDTIRIDFPHYDAYIEAVYEIDFMEGFYVLNTKENYKIPFKAQFNQQHRFTNLQKPTHADISGKWEVTFFEDDSTESKALGEFKQEGNYLTGTFLTTTGDYRYLEGTVQGDREGNFDKMYLSCFDGSHAFYFEAKVEAGGKKMVNGGFMSGSHYKVAWEAMKNDAYQLPDPTSLTKLNTGNPVAFSFPNEQGKMVSLSDPAYQNKVVLLSIMGTWCPNCGDEAAFLHDIYRDYKSKGLEVIGLAFERSADQGKASKAVALFQRRFGVDYEVLIAGISKKDEASKMLPFLDGIKAYPTLVVLDKKGLVHQIYTGFSGPATSAYKDFDASFRKMLDALVL